MSRTEWTSHGIGGPGINTRRLGPVVLWRAWPHANAGRSDYFLARGVALTRSRARQAAWDRAMPL